jgi:hypothetical protein
MVPARGDSKPCTHADCVGRMHFKRNAEDELRWMCSKDAQHEAALAEEGADQAYIAPNAR